MAPVFFPLDEELALLPDNLSPCLSEALVRLSTHIPSFAKAAQELALFIRVELHADTARCRTEHAGTLLVAHETAEAARMLREHPALPCALDTLALSVDGAMVPLLRGQWTEVRTLAVGEVQPAEQPTDGPGVQTANLSSFSRRTDSATLSELATLELHRRGIEAARRVRAVVHAHLAGTRSLLEASGSTWCGLLLVALSRWKHGAAATMSSPGGRGSAGGVEHSMPSAQQRQWQPVRISPHTSIVTTFVSFASWCSRCSLAFT